MVILKAQFVDHGNDQQHLSESLDPIVFADDRNLFYSHQDINSVFSTVNTEKNQTMVSS